MLRQEARPRSLDREWKRPTWIPQGPLSCRCGSQSRRILWQHARDARDAPVTPHVAPCSRPPLVWGRLGCPRGSVVPDQGPLLGDRLHLEGDGERHQTAHALKRRLRSSFPLTYCLDATSPLCLAFPPSFRSRQGPQGAAAPRSVRPLIRCGRCKLNHSPRKQSTICGEVYPFFWERRVPG